jgi:hypothetical protein
VLDCQAGTAPVVDDSVACTDDSCDEGADVVVNAPNAGNCDNGLFCDGSETCDALLGCEGGSAPTLDDLVVCTDDSCDESTDTVVNAPNDGSCSDGQFCNGAETCDALLDCQAGTLVAVDDGVECTLDSCDEGGDLIVHAPDHGFCDNSQFCDGVETCDALLDCQAGTAPSVDDGVICTDDSCDEGADAIVNAVNDSNCDNGLFCDGAEICDAVLDCQAGTAPTIDDGVTCTDDSCDEAADSVVNGLNDGLCDDGDPCTADSCDGVTGCANDPIIGCADTDGDGVVDSEDNCPNDFNPGQEDRNGNGVGEACETILVPATPLAGLLLIGLLLTLAAGLLLRVKSEGRLS